MIRHLRREQIEVDKWDQCVSMAYNGMVYGQSWYLDMMSDHWSGLVLGDYEVVMPLTYRSKFGFFYLYQPRFTQQFGIYSNAIISKELVHSFIENIPSFYRYADINLNKECLQYTGGKAILVRNNFIVDLNRSYENIRRSYSANTKMNVKRTERPDEYHMKLENIDDPEVVIRLFSTHQIKYSDRFKATDYDKLKRLVEYCREREMIELVGVSDRTGEFCAGTILLHYQNRKISIFSGSNALARKQKTMFLLFDKIIQRYAGQNLILDFAGSNDPGLANFYSGFASLNEQYPMLRYNHLPWFIKIFKK